MQPYRHISTLAFLPLFLLNSGEGAKIPKRARGVLAYLLIASLCSGFLFNYSYAKSDALNPYSENKAIATFLIENGYDADDALILSTRADLDSVIKVYMKNVKTFRALENGIPYDLTFSPWQLRSAYAPMGSESPMGFAVNQTEANKSNYRAIIFILPLTALEGETFDYKLIFKSSGVAFDGEMTANVYLMAENGVIMKEERNE
jgi:hypothetical protein